VNRVYAGTLLANFGRERKSGGRETRPTVPEIVAIFLEWSGDET